MGMALMLVPVMAFASKLPCGHEDTDPGDHSEADCEMPDHYNCDGKTHGMACYSEMLEGLGDILGGLGIEIPGIPTIPTQQTGPSGSTQMTEMTQPSGPPPIPPVPSGKELPAAPLLEIEVPKDGDDLDYELVREKIEEAARKGVWKISCDGTDSSPDSDLPQFFVNYVTLNFEAIKTGSEEMFGRYSGEGTLETQVDTSGYTAASAGLLIVRWAAEATIEPVVFELFDFSKKDDEDLGSLVPEGIDDPEDLGSLVPEGNDDPEDLGSLVPAGNKAHQIGYGGAIATVNSHLTENWSNIAEEASPHITDTYEVNFYIYVYDSGVVTLFMTTRGLAKGLEYWGRISRVIDGKLVN